ncbi:hypothetical protein ABPG77_006305 [Micractinium sp. CCAP 211/92]
MQSHKPGRQPSWEPIPTAVHGAGAITVAFCFIAASAVLCSAATPAVPAGYCLEADTAASGGQCTRGPFTLAAGEVSRSPLITTSNNSFRYFGYGLAADGSPLSSIIFGGNVSSGDYQGIDPSTGKSCSLSTTTESATCYPFKQVEWTGCLGSYTEVLECNDPAPANPGSVLSADYAFADPGSPQGASQWCSNLAISDIAADQQRSCLAEILPTGIRAELCSPNCTALWQDFPTACRGALADVESVLRNTGIPANFTRFSQRCLPAPIPVGEGPAPAPADSAVETNATYARAYEECVSSSNLEATINIFNQAVSSSACNESLFGYTQLDGRNATGYQCPEECKALWEKWSPSCYGLLSYAVDTLYSDASLANTYFRRQSDGTFWNLAGVSNWTASFKAACLPAAYLAGVAAPPAPAPATPDDGGGSSVGAAVGGAIGGIVAIAAAAAGFVWWRRRKAARQPSGARSGPDKAHAVVGGSMGPAAIDSYLDASESGALGPLAAAMPGKMASAGGRSGSIGLDAADKLAEKSFGSTGTPKSVGGGVGPSIGSTSGLTSSYGAGDGGLLMSFIQSQLSSGGQLQATPRAPGPGIDSRWHIPFGQLKVHELVGQGSFGQVYRATWAGHTEVAVKLLIDKAPGGGSSGSVVVASSPVLAAMEEEADLMLSLRHPNCCAIVGVVTTPPCLVTEYLSRGSLTDVLRSARADEAAARALTWPLRLQMALDAAKGMAYLHGRSPPIIHRDFKSPNLLVDRSWTVKVSDFNLSKHLSESLRSSSKAAMNPRWLAPEVMQGERATQAADVFSFAVVMWELLMWELPWSSTNPWQLVNQVTRGERLPLPDSPEGLPGPPATRPTPAQLSEYCDLLRCCWAQSPAHRPPFGDVVDSLREMLAAAEAAHSVAP